MDQPKPDELPQLVRAMVHSYTAEPRTRHIDLGCLPSRDAIIAILRLLRELLFPGYVGRQDLASDQMDYHVGRLIIEIRAKLAEQVELALNHQACRQGDTALGHEAQAKELVWEFMKSIPQLRDTLATDVQAAFDGDPAAGSTDEIIFSYPGFFATSIHRIAHLLYRRGVPLIPRIMSEYAHNLTGIDIHPGATIGPYFFIDHGTGVVIGETTVIGSHVKLYQGVTLGALSTRGGQALRGVKRHPTLEDSVTVYSGASILGGETVIGSGAVIGSNVFVTQSVPAGTRVTMRNPELQYRDQKPQEFKQELPANWVI